MGGGGLGWGGRKGGEGERKGGERGSTVVVVGIDIVPHNNESRILISEFFILQPPPDT